MRICICESIYAAYWIETNKQRNKRTFGLYKFQFICVNHLFCVIFSLISGVWGFGFGFEYEFFSGFIRGNPHKSIRTLFARFWQPIFGFAAYLLCIIFFHSSVKFVLTFCGAEFGFRFWFRFWLGGSGVASPPHDAYSYVTFLLWLIAHLRLIYEVPSV